MSKEDYEAISKLIEAVIGKDTIAGVRLLEGIKFYFNSKIKEIRKVKSSEIKIEIPIVPSENRTNHTKGAEEAMKNYTAQLNKENSSYKKNIKKGA